jgi:hypothetical protein
VYFISDLLYLIKNRYDKDKITWNPLLKGIATMSITVTFLVAYFAYTMVAAQMGGICPYPFIDVNRLGRRQVMLNVSVLTVFFILLGYLSFAVEKILIKIDGRQ